MELNGLHEPVLIGNSLGCQIITELAVRYPQYVSRAVLQGPTVDPHGRTWRQQLVQWLLDSQREPPSQALIMLRDYRAAGFRRVIRTFQYTREDRIEERLPRMLNPTLVVRTTPAATWAATDRILHLDGAMVGVTDRSGAILDEVQYGAIVQLDHALPRCKRAVR